MRALWKCPDYGRSFANRNQFHFCSKARLEDRIAFQVRMSFAAFTLRRRWVDGHVVLARRLESPRFRRIDVISPRNQVHVFRLHQPSEVDAEVEAWLAEAYLVGEQRHLGMRPQASGSES